MPPDALAAGLLSADWPETAPPAELDFIGAQVAEASEWMTATFGEAPVVDAPMLGQRFGRRVRIRFESLSPIRSFKARGALTFMSSLSAAQRRAGVITASTGNHAQGVAWAAKQCDARAQIILPRDASPAKLRALHALGADIDLRGANLAEAARIALERSQGSGQTYLEDGENGLLMLGAATVMWDFLKRCPSLDAVLLPVGGGNLIAGSLLAVQAAGLQPAVIGVQSEAASGATASWLVGHVVERPCETVAGGLATTIPGELSLRVMRAKLRSMAIVSEDDLWRGIGLLWAATGQIGEHAAVAGLACLDRFGESIDGDDIGLVVTGSHLSAAELSRALEL